ncbi:MAG: fructose-bisphosphatase class II [Candidatus Kaelpia imicola]|nr:fructose-bisphosphatase class II [Candidatus Kaelpia imicola]
MIKKLICILGLIIIFPELIFNNTSIELSLRRTQEPIQSVPQIQLFTPNGDSQFDYGFKQAGEVEINSLFGEVDSSIFEQPGMEVLRVALAASIAAKFGSGQAAPVSDAKPVVSNIKAKMDLAAVRAAQNQLVELCKTTGYVVVLEGEEGPGRDSSAGAIPGTLFTSQGMILPKYYQVEEFCSSEGKRYVPDTIADVLKVLEWEHIGIGRDEVKGVIFIKFDTIENTTSTALGEIGGWSFASMRMFSFPESGATSPDILNIPAHYTPDGYIGGWTFNAPQPVSIAPYELPESAVPKLAAAYGETVDEYLSKTRFVILQRARHQRIIDDLKAMGATYVTMKDGDMPPRVFSLMQEEVLGERIVVLGTSGACEASAAVNTGMALRDRDAQFSLLQTTTESGLLHDDVTGWHEGGAEFSDEEIGEFQALNIPIGHYTQGISVSQVVTSTHESRFLFLIPVTGAREELIGNMASELPGIEIIEQGNGAKVNIHALVVYSEGRRENGGAFILTIPLQIQNLQRTRALMLHLGRQFIILEETPR